MELRKQNFDDAYEQWRYVTELPTDENGLTNSYHGVTWDEYREEVLPRLMSYENPVDMPKWFVPESYFYLWDENRLIGEFRIRHYLTEALKKGAGHIGYSIKREYRRQGYGTKGLELALVIAKKIVPEDEIYLRLLKSNIASYRAMEKNGTRVVGEDEEHLFMRIKNKANSDLPSCILRKIYRSARGADILNEIAIDSVGTKKRMATCAKLKKEGRFDLPLFFS